MSESNTAQSVMGEIENMSRNVGLLDPHLLLLGAVKLSALLQTEEEHLAEMEHTLIKRKAKLIEEGKTAVAAKTIIEADDLYLEVMKQRAFIKRCDSVIMLAKKHATISSDQAKY